MIRRVLLALLLLAGCSRPAKQTAAEVPAPGQLPTDVVNEQTSLLDITRGASIVSRTGESMLLASPVNTIDGDVSSFWTPPPHDYPQSIVIALGTTSRIDRVGFRTLTERGYEANHLTFESSRDGAAWKPLGTMASRHISEAQWMDVAPLEAAYLRVTIPDAKYPTRDVRLRSLLAHGTEVAPRNDPPLTGCWSINGDDAAFFLNGSFARGVVAQGKQPTLLAGGTNGRMWRFNWIRGNDYGYSALTISPDGNHLSSINWHEEAIPLFVTYAWFGERSGCVRNLPNGDALRAILNRAGHVSMFALQFDSTGQLLAGASRDELGELVSLVHGPPYNLRIVAHEFRQPDAARNKAFAKREIASLRNALANLSSDLAHIDFVAAGSDAPRQTPASDAARAIYSSVELELRR